MRKQLHEVQEIDKYLLHEMTAAERLVFQARMLVAPGLGKQVGYQRRAYQIIRWFARNEKRKKLEAVCERLMKDEKFNLELTSIFK